MTWMPIRILQNDADPTRSGQFILDRLIGKDTTGTVLFKVPETESTA